MEGPNALIRKLNQLTAEMADTKILTRDGTTIRLTDPALSGKELAAAVKFVVAELKALLAAADTIR